MAPTLLARRGAASLLAIVATIALLPTMALATWRVHNDVDITQIDPAPVPGGTEEQTCPDALHGQSAWSTSVPPDEDPESLRPATGSPAYQPVDYVVWKAPPGASGGDFVEADDGGVDYQLPNGDSVPAIFVMQFTTPARATVAPQLVFPPASTTSDNLYLFSLTNFTAPLPTDSAHRVAVGDILGVKPASGGSTFIDLSVIDCTPGPVTARIDVLPGVRPNYVVLKLKAPVLPVLVYGSAALDVRSITSVRLQDAAPGSVPSVLTKPFDANHDGKLDRVYWFAPSATGIRCGQTSVTLTGRTSSGLRFTGTDSIRTVC
jgi:hypothetical protein